MLSMASMNLHTHSEAVSDELVLLSTTFQPIGEDTVNTTFKLRLKLVKLSGKLVL